MEAISFYSRLNEPTKLRSIASRCAEAARSCGLTARTLAYRGSDSRFLYKGENSVFVCAGWKSLLYELRIRGATIPSDHWSSEINNAQEV